MAGIDPTASPLLFTALTFDEGSELYSVDADDNVVRLTDIDPGRGSAFPEDFFAFNGEVYFSAFSASFGRELYKVSPDGSVQQVADINPGAVSADPEHFAIFDGALYFVADSASFGSELHRLDADGDLQRVTDIAPDALNASPSGLTVFNDELYFSATDGSLGAELYKLTANGSVIRMTDIAPGPESSASQELTLFNDALYFKAFSGPGVPESEIYKLTAAGSLTQLSIDPADRFSGPTGTNQFILFNDALYFSGFTTATGRELFRVTSADSVELVIDIRPNPPSDSRPENLTEFNDELYFSASAGSGSGLHKVTSSGSVVAVTGVQPADFSVGRIFIGFDGELYMTGTTPSTGFELFKLMAGNSIVLAEDVEPLRILDTPQELTLHNGELFFAAFTSSFGRELYKVTAAGSLVRFDDLSGDDYAEPEELIEFDSELYFRATSFSFGEELYKVSTTASGVVRRVADINTGSSGMDSSSPEGFFEFGGELYFVTTTTASSGRELYKLTASDSVMFVASVDVGGGAFEEPAFGEFMGDLYFNGTTSSFGTELHKLTAGGSLVRFDGVTLETRFARNGFTEFDGEFYFLARSDSFGRELHKITATGSVVRVSDINPGNRDANVENLIEFNGELFFAADSDDSDSTTNVGVELFKLTAAGSIVLVADLETGPSGSFPRNFTIFDGALYFTADTGFEDGLFKITTAGSVIFVGAPDGLGIVTSSRPEDYFLFESGELTPDRIATNETGDISIPTATLLANDSAGFELVGVGNRGGEGMVSLDNGDVVVSGEVSRFDYAAASSGDVRSTQVFVERQVGAAVNADPGENTLLIGTTVGDLLVGNDGNDLLLGHGGPDSLTGGAGRDLFVLAEGDGGATLALADTIVDFTGGEDEIGLLNGLTFSDLTLDASLDRGLGDGGTNDTVITVTATSEVLAFVQDASGLTEADFTTLVVS